MVLGIGLGGSLDIGHWRTLRLLGNRSVIKQTKRPLLKNTARHLPSAMSYARWFLKKLKIGLIFLIAIWAHSKLTGWLSEHWSQHFSTSEWSKTLFVLASGWTPRERMLVYLGGFWALRTLLILNASRIIYLHKTSSLKMDQGRLEAN